MKSAVLFQSLCFCNENVVFHIFLWSGDLRKKDYDKFEETVYDDLRATDVV